MRQVKFGSLALCLALAASAPAWPELRLDAGLIVPQEVDFGGIGAESGSNSVEAFFDELPLLPMPGGGLYYQRSLEGLKLGIGGRAYSIVAESVAWPEAYAELKLGRWDLDARIGGGAFFMAGILNQAAFGAALIPELSAWYELGRRGTFRLGAGTLGLYVPDVFGNSPSLLLFLGAKASFEFH